MNKWLVITPGGDNLVNALEAIITPCGDLVFKIQDGCVQHAFSKGAWSECRLVEVATQGYGVR